jgi:hypothetical protein
MKEEFNFFLPPNPFLLPAGRPIDVVNCQNDIIDRIFLEKETDITFGFSQKNSAGIMINYRNVVYHSANGTYHVQEG